MPKHSNEEKKKASGMKKGSTKLNVNDGKSTKIYGRSDWIFQCVSVSRRALMYHFHVQHVTNAKMHVVSVCVF